MVTDGLDRHAAAEIHCRHPLDETDVGLAVVEAGSIDGGHLFVIVVLERVDEFGDQVVQELIEPHCSDDRREITCSDDTSGRHRQAPTTSVDADTVILHADGQRTPP